MLKTFSIQTLGCRVNQYEGEQMAAFLRARGLTAAADPGAADLRIVHTCSVTLPAAGKSRQLARRVSLAQFPTTPSPPAAEDAGTSGILGATGTGPPTPEASEDGDSGVARPRVVLTGCWATSDPAAAAALPGVDAVVGHRQDVAAELGRLLQMWEDGGPGGSLPAARVECHPEAASPRGISGSNDSRPRDPSGLRPFGIADGPAAGDRETVTYPSAADATPPDAAPPPGMTSLPLLDGRQTGRQRAHLKVQDGCDAHCTYCIIPRLRPALWSKPPGEAVEEARRLVAAGHVELVLTGIFLGAYGQPTALRRRQPDAPGRPLAALVDALCTRVPGLRRLRLSSLEPGDLTPDLLAVLRSHPQVVPHFHLPLQSGSDALLRRMNRQYTRGDFLGLVDRVRAAFDRPALTTDVIVGFPGETDEEFRRTVEVVDAAGFIHVHAFSYSPRPGTAAARWTRGVVRGPVVNDRIADLRRRADGHRLSFRRQFVGETVELLVERDGTGGTPSDTLRHGRCERYFPVYFEGPNVRAGDFVRARVERVTDDRTFGSLDCGAGFPACTE